jgi:hypothetical protein
LNNPGPRGFSAASEKIIDRMINRRLYLLAGVLSLTVFFGYHAGGLQQDPTMKSGVNTSSPEYAIYQRFLEEFGNEEFVLMAAQFPESSDSSKRLADLAKVTSQIKEVEQVASVMSVVNFKLFRERDGYYGSYPIIVRNNDTLELPSRQRMERYVKAVSIVDLLVSDNRLTYGVIIKLKEEARYDPTLIGKTLDDIKKIAASIFDDAVDFRFIGGPVVRHAIEKYNLQTAIFFGVICTIIATITSTYIFKSIRVSVINMSVVGLCVIWMMGMMSLLDITINSTTALAFGLVLLVSAAAVIHITTHFNERYYHKADKVVAVKEALLVVGRPCLMCAITTATGFASITISDIPMIKQLGIIMAVAVMVAYILAVIVTPTLLMIFNPPSGKDYGRMQSDWVAVIFTRLKSFVYGHSRICALLIGVFAIFMVSSVPYIRSDTQILRMLSDRTPEMKDMKFVEDKLGDIHSIELVINREPGDFRKMGAWEEISHIHERLIAVNEVSAVDSLLPILKYLGRLVSDDESKGDALKNEKLIPQLLTMISLGAGGNEIINRYVSEDYSKARISVRIKNSPGLPIGKTIRRIKEAALKGLNEGSSLTVTGDLAFFESQASELVWAQTISLFIALTCITALMIIQFKSVALGLMSLIPNLLPLTIIFGSMGWFGIPLDTVTVFAAAVSIGLSVDDTIHYLTQLKREMECSGGGERIEDCLDRAYTITAKALISTSAVLFVGFIALVGSPFRPVIYFGLLGSMAIVTALVGDLVFLPALILSVPLLRRIMQKRMPVAAGGEA